MAIPVRETLPLIPQAPHDHRPDRACETHPTMCVQVRRSGNAQLTIKPMNNACSQFESVLAHQSLWMTQKTQLQTVPDQMLENVERYRPYSASHVVRWHRRTCCAPPWSGSPCGRACCDVRAHRLRYPEGSPGRSAARTPY